MIHNYTGPTCASRSPQTMRKEPRPLSIIDEDPTDITNWKRESENGTDCEVGDVTTGRKDDKDLNSVQTDEINGSKHDRGSELANTSAISTSDFEKCQTSTDDAGGNENCVNALNSDVSGKFWLSSANAPVETLGQESQVVPERRRSIRRLAVAPLEHPVFLLEKDDTSIESDNTVDNEASGASVMKIAKTGSTKNGLKDVKFDVSCNENITENSVWSHKDSNGPLGVQRPDSPETNGACRPGSRQYDLTSNDENPAVLCSYVHDQFSDAPDGENGENCDMSDEKQKIPTRVPHVFSNGNSVKIATDISSLSRNGSVSHLVKLYNGFTTNSKTQRQNFAEEPSFDLRKREKNMETSQPSFEHPSEEQLSEENDDEDNKETSVIEEEPLDKEQMAWKNRVRQSFSFASLSNRSRPIRRSVSSFDFKNSSTDRNSGNKLTRKFSDTTGNVQFYISEEHSGFYKEEAVGNHADDNISGQTSGFDRQLTSRDLARQRKSSWQEIYNLRQKSLAMGVPLDKESRLTWSKNLESRKISLGEISQSNTDGHTKSNYGLLNVNSNEVTTQETNQSNSPSIRRISAIDQSDFRLLKDTATRLNLPTRRPSTMAWRAQYIDNQQFLAHPLMFSNNNNNTTTVNNNNYSKDRYDDNGDDISAGGDDVSKPPTKDDEPLTVERKNRINESLSWLKQELINIRLQDQSLARQFLGLRHTMNKLRLAAECEDHKDLLDVAEEEMEEMRELSRLVDIPIELLTPLPPLQHLGVTRMNLTSRRFSTC